MIDTWMIVVVMLVMYLASGTPRNIPSDDERYEESKESKE